MIGTVDILIVGPTPPPKGGVSIHIQRLANHLAGSSISFHILDESRVEKHFIPNLRKIGPLAYLGTMRRAHLIHIHSSNNYVRLIHTLVARFFGAKVLQTVHSLQGGRMSRFCLRIAAALSNANIGVSERVCAGISPDAKAIPAFISPDASEEIVPEDIQAWCAAAQKAGKKIIALNAFRPEILDGRDLYGIDMFIDAFARGELRKSFAFIACISTNYDCEDYYEKLVSRLDALAPGDDFRIVLGQSNFPGILRLCDVFVRPTTTDGDALSVREALWYGVPAIASDAAKRPEGTIIFRTHDLDDMCRCVAACVGATRSVPSRTDFGAEVVKMYRQYI